MGLLHPGTLALPAAAFVAIILLVPAAAADDTLYFAGDGLTLAPPTGSEVERHPLTTRSHGGEPGGRLDWTYTIREDASILPRAITFYIEATQPVAVPPAGGVGTVYPGPLDFCPFYFEVYTESNGWWYCRHAFAGSVILPGTHRIDVDFNELDLERLDVEAGETLHVLLLTDVVSHDPEPVLYFLSGAKQADSHLVLDGSKENATAPGPGPGLNPTSGPDATSGQSSATSGGPSAESSLPGKDAPQLGLPLGGVLVAAAALVARRRGS